MRVILLPGLDGTGVLFKPLLEQLPSDIHTEVIAYPADQLLGYSQLERYVEENLPEDEEYRLVGESFSGYIAYRLARKKRNRLKSVIFVASFLRPPLRLMRLAHILPLSIMLKAPIPRFALRRYLLGREAGDEEISLFKGALKKVSGELLAFRLREVANLDAKLEQLDIPCTYIQARDDKLVPSNNIDLFRRVVRELKEISVTGPHFILQARPTECAKVVAEECRFIANRSS